MTIIYDPETRQYALDGRPVPRVTDVIATEFGRYYDPSAAARGTEIHHLTYLRDGGMDEPVPEELAGWVAAWERCQSDTEMTIERLELRVGHPLHGYAGTLDRIVRIQGQLAVVDLKSVAEMREEIQWGLQLAAYREAFNYRRQEKSTHSLVAILLPDGNYRLREFKEHALDFEMFRALLVRMQWRQKNGLT